MRASQSDRMVIDKKRTIILLRSVVVISTSYLILFSNVRLTHADVAYILALILSNIGLTLTPKEWFHKPSFSAALLLGDTAVVLVGLYLTVGCFSQDFLIIYFFTIFLTTATESVGQIALGSAMVSGLYGYWLSLTASHPLGAGEWLRLPFFFIVAVFYAYVTEQAKHERWTRQQVERESDHLRFLLSLSDTVSERNVTEELIRRIGSLIETAFPRLTGHVCFAPAEAQGGTGASFLLHTHDRTFGVLQVGTKDGGPLNPDEQQFCKVVATMAANALYTSEQISAAQDGTRLKEEFLAILSHELRSPLHVILGNAEIIAEELKPQADDFMMESIDRLRASALRLMDLIEELLCFAELRGGKAATFLERVDIREFFEHFTATMREQLAGRPVRFECDIRGDVPVLQTDRRKLRLIINGLLGNAVKFTDSGFVRLSARCTSPEQLEITVEDSGIGIAPTDLGSIFEEFRQVDGSLTRRYGGLGLGLALAREMAMTLCGRIEAESQPHHGSRFRLLLPISEKTAAKEAPAAAQSLCFEPAA
jgi:signal transduction histidine kinase